MGKATTDKQTGTKPKKKHAAAKTDIGAAAASFDGSCRSFSIAIRHNFTNRVEIRGTDADGQAFWLTGDCDSERPFKISVTQ